MSTEMPEANHDVRECPINMDDKMQRLEKEIGEVRATVTVLDDRQRRMHEDFKGLSDALEKNTEALNEFAKVLVGRKGFTAGVITVVTLVGGALAAGLGMVLEWFK